MIVIPLLNAKDSKSTIEEKIQKFQKSHYLNGVVAVARDGKAIYVKGFGIADHTKGQLCTDKTQFFIGSVSKQITAAALLHLLWNLKPFIKDLKEYLSKPLAEFLPEKDHIWDGVMPEWANQVTLHQLLTNTSGVVSYTDVPEFNNVLDQEISAPNLAKMFRAC